MRFASPVYLLVLTLAIPAAAAFLRARERVRRRDLASLAEPALLARASALPRARRRRLRQGLGLLAAALLLLALARPQLGEEIANLPRAGRDLLVVLDLSRSMDAEDVAPSRLEAARRAARELAAAAPADRFGLVVFAGSAFLELPPTADRPAFERLLAEADTGDPFDPGTDLAEALATATAVLSGREAGRFGAVVLLSDGEGLEGDLEEALAALRGSGLRAFTLGVGTRDGAPISRLDGPGPSGHLRDLSGEVVVTRLEEGPLRRIAEATGGTYHWLGEGDAVPRLASELRRVERREATARARTAGADRYQWPLAAAVALLLVHELVRETSPRGPAPGPAAGRVLAAAWLWAAAALPAGSLAGQEPSPERLYRAGRFEQAYAAFRELAAERRDDGRVAAALEYNAANSLYRLGRVEQAARSWEEALAGPPELRQKSQYNLGNARVGQAEGGENRIGRLRQAVAAYEAALLLQPRDPDAKWNLEWALRKLEEELRWRGMAQWREGAGASAGNEDEALGELTAGNAAPGAGAAGLAGGAGPEQLAPVPELTEPEARRLVQSLREEEARDVRPGAEAAATRKKDW